MGMYIDTADIACTSGTRALLDTLDDSTFVSLGVLFGTDLCVLGGTSHPTCWQPLKSEWHRLDQRERDQLAEQSTQAMRDRDLLTEQPAGRGVKALIVPACYKMNSKLRILLSARESPAFMIATHHESRTPAVTYFQPRGTNVIVQEIPERTDDTARSPLDVMFSYRLSTQAFAAAELARWALKPVPAARYQPKPPRLISFFGRTEGGRQTSYQLTIHRNGKKAHIDGPDISADFGSPQLNHFLADTVTKWADSHRSIDPLASLPSSASPGRAAVELRSWLLKPQQATKLCPDEAEPGTELAREFAEIVGQRPGQVALPN